MDETGRRTAFPFGWVAALVLVAAVVALVLIVPGGEDADTLLLDLDYDPAAVEESVEEALSPVTLRPSETLRVTGRSIRWLDADGRAFLETPRVVFTVQLNAAAGGVLVSDGLVEQPRVRLVQTGPDRWNYERPLAPLLERDADGAGRGGAALAFRLRDIRVTGGHVTLVLPEATYEARSLDASLTAAELSGPGVLGPTFQIARAETELVLPDTAGGTITRAASVADARIRLVDGTVAFDVASATFGGSRFASAEGVWTPGGPGLGLELRATVVEARLADLPWLPGEVPEGATGQAVIRVEPRPGGRTGIALTGLEVRAPGSSATGSLRVVIGGARAVLESIDLRVDPLALDLVEAFTGPLPYGGQVAGTIRGTGGDLRVDLQGQLTTAGLAEPFAADLTGRIALTEEGFTLRDAAVAFEQLPLAALEPLAPGLPLAGRVTGTVNLTGPPGTGPLTLDLRLEAGGGIITIAGTADLTGAVPAYDVGGRVTGVRLQAVLEPAVPPAEVHATFQLEGRGTDPRSLDASLVANGTFTGWESEPGDTLVVRATVADGTADVADLRAQLGPISLAAAGQWDYVGGSGTITYEAIIAEVRPLAPYLPPGPGGERPFAQGAARLAGTASGTLDSPVLEGTIEADDFRWGTWATRRLAADYFLNVTEGLPVVRADLTADELRSPLGDFTAVAANVDFGRPAFAVEFRADQPGDRGIVQLEADGTIDEAGQREIFLRTLEVDLQQQRWRLPEPARLAWTTGDEVRLEDVELRQVDGEGRLALEGVIAPVDAMDLGIEIQQLPVGDVLELIASDLEISGDLSASGRLAGPSEAPTLDMSVTLDQGAFRGVAVRTLTSEVRYDGTQLVVDGTGLLGDSARVEIGGTIPARIQLAAAPFFALVDAAPIDLRIRTDAFPLATIDPGLTTLEGLEGQLHANLRVGGTPAEPALSGSAQLVQGAATLPLLGRRFENIQGAVVLTGRQARLREVVVQSDGTARLTGTLDFVNLTDPSLDLSAELERFRVQEIDDEQAAAIWGSIQLAGTLTRPVVTGSVRADDGAVSLVPFQQPSLSQQLMAADDLDRIDPTFDLDLNESGDVGLRVQGLRVVAGEDLWFVMEDARARLSGTLTVNRSAAGVAIQGVLQGEGGTFQLVAGPVTRQFQIVSSEVRFFGSPDPNPRVDIVASRLVRTAEGADLDVRVQVSGTLANPALNLGTGTGAEVPESELLSFLLFGRPTADLGQIAGGGVEGALGQGLAYAGILEGLTSGIAEEVGVLDYFRVEYVPGLGLFATAGWEVTRDVFLNADVPLEEDAGFALGLEYRTRYGLFRGAWEPVQRQDWILGARTFTLLDPEIRRQGILAWRKRWTY